MPVHTYVEQTKVYKCLQYDGTNYEEVAAFAPVTQIEGVVYLIDPYQGNLPMPVGHWVMQDIFDVFMLIPDELFQKGYRPGGGPVISQ